MPKLKSFQQFLNENRELLESSHLEVLKKHLDRTDISLAQWIVKNLHVNGSDTPTPKEAEAIIKSVDSKEYYSKLPSMYFFDSPAEDVESGTWLVHFTRKPQEIEKQGFIHGEPDFLKLGMSWGSQSDKPGYNYAFVPEDAIEKYGSLEKAFRFWVPRGGAIFFKAPAIKDYHFGDEVEEVLFWGADATQILGTKREEGVWTFQGKKYSTLDEIYKEVKEL
jgi:hypothetical protein